MVKLNSEQVSIDQIHSNFKALAKEYHPDVRQEDPLATEKFQEITDAYNQILASCKDQKETEKKYSTRVHISLADAIMGCERYCSSGENQKQLLKIPAGVKHGGVIRYSNVLLPNGQNGTLNVRVFIALPENYYMGKDFILQKIYISWWKAFFGGIIEITAPDNKTFYVRVPSQLKDRAVFAIAGRGLWDSEKQARSPLYVEFFVRPLFFKK